ncbi:acid protease [Amniculicola lignicola CBS 123094]|uniref:Acid protease n=1 Tax=Amniculicola lignicola CBS 123094 TaxID=1392246 RepID=A0A6A5WWP0_9PLEO|nr:acid protease [Amniculicola lignicola CBS 123094]
MPEPFSLAPSGQWDGNDGHWSSFSIKLGTPERSYRVFPDTFGYDSAIPSAKGCKPDDPKDCIKWRGADDQGFKSEDSKSWDEIGEYVTSFVDELEGPSYAIYGLDTITIPIEGGGTHKLEKQAIAMIEEKKPFIGSLGLAPVTSEYLNNTKSGPSVMEALRDQKLLPSVSYGYTAGAYYKNPKVQGSLTFGGYDASRLDDDHDSVRFPFAFGPAVPQEHENITVGIWAIEATGTQTPGTDSFHHDKNSLVGVIDSSISHFWFPSSLCETFEKNFGLTYNKETDFYTIDDKTHDRLVKDKASVKFTLGYPNMKGDPFEVTFPYEALNMEPSWPLYKDAKRIFPMRKNKNGSADYPATLGRTFLQEVYLMVNYDKSEFELHKAVLDNVGKADLQTIDDKAWEEEDAEGATAGGASKSKKGKKKGFKIKLKTPVIIGIAVGAGVLIILAVVVLCCIKRKKGPKKMKGSYESLRGAAPVAMKAFQDNHRTGAPQPYAPYIAGGNHGHGA